VDGIERQHMGELMVVRVNVQDPAARPWLERFAFRVTPTFVLLDGQGQEVWRSVGSIDAAQVAAVIRGL
jgi:thioredoxin-related protein